MPGKPLEKGFEPFQLLLLLVNHLVERFNQVFLKGQFDFDIHQAFFAHASTLNILRRAAILVRQVGNRGELSKQRGDQHAAHAAVRAAQLGITPEAMYARNPLRVSAEGVVGYGQAVSPGQTSFDLDGVTVPVQNANGIAIHPTNDGVLNFWRWFNGGIRRNRLAGEAGSSTDHRGADRVDLGDPARSFGLDKSGRPRVFYHGSRDSIAAFDLAHPNRKDNGWLGRGVYLSNDPQLAAIERRLEKLPRDLVRDTQHLRDMTPLIQAAATLKGDKSSEFRWALEELRVSLFAQELKTPEPTSIKRLEKRLAEIRR